MNVQYAVHGGALYVIEANPRASRTVPFVSKAIGIPLAKMACRMMLGEKIADLGLPEDPMRADHVWVKEAVLPFDRFEGSDAMLGPGDALHRRGDGHRPRLPDGVRQGAGGRRRRAAHRWDRVHHRHRLRQGRGGRHGPDAPRPRLPHRRHSRHEEAIERMGVPAVEIKKLGEGSPNVVDWIESGEVDLVVKTPDRLGRAL